MQDFDYTHNIEMKESVQVPDIVEAHHEVEKNFEASS